MDVRICQHKCPDKEDCEAYMSCDGTVTDTKHGPLAEKSRSVEIGGGLDYKGVPLPVRR